MVLAAIAALIVGGGTALAATGPSIHPTPNASPSFARAPAQSPEPAESPETADSPEPADSPDPAESPEAEGSGVHGGTAARFHDASACNLVNVAALHGNWTHGDYVSAVAAQHPSEVRQAAHSRCGKPMQAGG